MFKPLLFLSLFLPLLAGTRPVQAALIEKGEDGDYSIQLPVKDIKDVVDSIIKYVNTLDRHQEDFLFSWGSRQEFSRTMEDRLGDLPLALAVLAVQTHDRDDQNYDIFRTSAGLGFRVEVYKDGNWRTWARVMPIAGYQERYAYYSEEGAWLDARPNTTSFRPMGEIEIQWSNSFDGNAENVFQVGGRLLLQPNPFVANAPTRALTEIYSDVRLSNGMHMIPRCFLDLNSDGVPMVFPEPGQARNSWRCQMQFQWRLPVQW